MKNKIVHVRNMCIEGMERLLHPEENESFGVNEAKALAALAKVTIESGKLEFQQLKLLVDNGIITSLPNGTDFMPIAAQSE